MDGQRLTRRRVLKWSAGLGGLAVLSPAAGTATQPLRRTPNQTAGPFYPSVKPLDTNADLTRVAGRSERASGQIVHLTGRVLNRHGAPVPGASVEIWQANAHGRYAHPADSSPAPLDPNFQGFAVQTTDAEGRYRFTTIKPAAYHTSPGGDWIRPPHIHFAVTGNDDRVVTQMYFPDEPLNERDGILLALGDAKDSVIATLMAPPEDLEPGSLLAVWDVVVG